MKLNVKALTLTGGLLGGFGLFFLTWWIIAFEGATGDSTWIGLIYRGYEISPRGSLIGFVWGFVDWAFGGAFVALIYNWFVSRSEANKA